MNGSETSETTPASQASNGSEETRQWPNRWSASEVAQLFSWISDTLEAHDYAGKPFLQATNLIAQLDDESVTGIFGNEEEKPTLRETRIRELAKALAKVYGREGVLAE